MNTYKMLDIQAGKAFKSELLLDPLFLIEPPDVPVEQSVITAIKEWEFDAVMCEEKVAPPPPPNTDAPKKGKAEKAISGTTEEVSLDDFLSDGDKKKSEVPKVPPPPVVKTPEARSAAAIGKGMPLAAAKDAAGGKTAAESNKEGKSETVKNAAIAAIKDSGKAAGNIGGGDNKARYSENERMENVKKVYADNEQYITQLFTRYATHNDMDRNELLRKVQELCEFIKENQRYILRIVPSQDAHRGNMFVSHSMRSTVLAITIGIEMRLAMSRLIELGTACILHEIGMLQLPPQLYAANKALTTSERVLMETHCVKGAAIAGILGFDDNVKNGIEDHHECKNGAGYPNRKMGDRISLYGKIIAVACSYEAITAPRHYKAARSGFEAMVEMLKNKEGRYDDTVIKALLYSLSLFPIGAFVFLSDGRIAQVTDVNPTDPKNPIVQLINERDANGDMLSVQTSATANKIVRVLSRTEVYDAIRSMKGSHSSDP